MSASMLTTKKIITIGNNIFSLCW